MPAPPPPRRTDRRPFLRHWGHLAGLAIALAGVSALVNGRQSVGPTLFVLLPWCAAVAMGLLRANGSARRRGAALALVTTLVMVGLDLLPVGVAPPLPGSVAFDGQSLVEQRQNANFANTPALATIAAALGGTLAGANELAERYPVDHPRARLSHAVLKAGFLLLPGILAGIVLGLSAWLSARVAFRSPLDERVVRLLLAWVGPVVVVWLVFRWSLSARVAVLFQGASMLTTLWPYLPFLVIAAFGWRASGRLTPISAEAARRGRSGDG